MRLVLSKCPGLLAPTLTLSPHTCEFRLYLPGLLRQAQCFLKVPLVTALGLLDLRVMRTLGDCRLLKMASGFSSSHTETQSVLVKYFYAKHSLLLFKSVGLPSTQG